MSKYTGASRRTSENISAEMRQFLRERSEFNEVQISLIMDTAAGFIQEAVDAGWDEGWEDGNEDGYDNGLYAGREEGISHEYIENVIYEVEGKQLEGRQPEDVLQYTINALTGRI